MTAQALGPRRELALDESVDRPPGQAGVGHGIELEDAEGIEVEEVALDLSGSASASIASSKPSAARSSTARRERP